MKKIVLFIAVLFSALSAKAYEWENVSLSAGAEVVSDYTDEQTESSTSA